MDLRNAIFVRILQVYTISGSKSIPSWLSDKKKKSLQKDEEYRRRIELIQDFEFPAACQRIKISSNGEYVFATGYHPPRVRVFDVNQLSMKFERHFDSEIIDFQILTEDYSKAAFLCADRSVALHARYGTHYRLRVPRMGRDLAYSPYSAELFIAASAPELYRISLGEGRFMAALSTKSPAINACGISPCHGLLACAGEDGILECFDPRQRNSLGWLDAAGAAGGHGQGLTSLRFDDGGMHVGVGTSGGIVAIYDLRSQRPMAIKDHMYDSPIVDLKFHTATAGIAGSQLVISSDKHAVRIWEVDSGHALATIEPPGAGINDVCTWPHSGLIMIGADSPRVHSFFIPSLGPAPPWCSFLENLTEELEENANPSVYDDYRFITGSDLEKLGLTHLIGTPMLKAYMHGFFIDNRLYKKAAAIAEPFAYEAYKQKRIAQKMEDERRSRIGIVRKLPKVNASTAARIIASRDDEDDGAAAKKKKKAAKSLPNLLEDDRFAAMFENPDFVVDETSKEYKTLHPNAGVDGNDRPDLVAEHFDEYSDDDDAEERAARQRRNERSKKLEQPRQPRMYAAKDGTSADAFMQRKSLAAERDMPLGKRATSAGARPVQARAGGSRELSFVPRRGPDGNGHSRGRGRGGSRGRGRVRGRGRGRK